MTEPNLTTRVLDLQANQAAFTMILAVLMRTHQDYESMQLQLTAMVEQQLEGGALGNTLTAAQRQTARDVVEWMQAVRKK